MIPSSWEPCHRHDDGELIGYLAPSGEAVVPMTLLGTPLDDPADSWTAEQVLERTGLSYLADRWLLRQEDGTEQRVVLIEVDPERALVGDAASALVVERPAELSARIEVSIPTDRLRRT